MKNPDKTCVFYVSQTKSAKEHCYATVQNALQAVAELRRNGNLQPVEILLEDELTCLSQPVVIGSDVWDVTLRPAKDTPAGICGGRRITGFTRGTFNGKACLCAPVPEAKSGQWQFTDLYVNGMRAGYTRYPEQGFLSPTDFECHENNTFAGSKWFIAHKEDLLPLTQASAENAIVSFCHYWVDEHSPVESYDPNTGRLTMTYKSRFSMASEHNAAAKLDYYLENVPFTFGKPNDWYLDKSAGMLYYMPRDDAMTPENIEVYAPVISQLFTVAGTAEQPVRGIRLRELELFCTRGDYASMANVNGESDGVCFAADMQAVSNAHGSVAFTHAHGCTMENCVMRNFGVHGVDIGQGCTLVRITGCSFTDGGAGGVRICGGDAQADPRTQTRNITVSNCRICHCGRRYMAACGILLMHAAACELDGNEISDLYYTGISCGWVWGYAPSVTRDCRITHNHIHHLGHGALSDMGGVYLLGTQPGTVVRDNLIHDVYSKTYGGWALYTDEGSSFITLENNTCYRTSDNIYHQHYGSFNTVRNNIFAFAGKEMLCVTRAEPHLSLIFRHNLIVTDGVPIYNLQQEHLTQGTVGASDNIIVNLQGTSPVFAANAALQARTLQQMQLLGMEQGTVLCDTPPESGFGGAYAEAFYALPTIQKAMQSKQ